MPDTVTIRKMKRPPKAISRFAGRKTVYVGEFTVNLSEATRYAGIAGKRKRWYLLRSGHAFEVYDKRGKYYGAFTRTELFGDRKTIIEG